MCVYLFVWEQRTLRVEADAAEPSEVGVAEYDTRELQAGRSADVVFDVLHKIIR